MQWIEIRCYFSNHMRFIALTACGKTCGTAFTHTTCIGFIWFALQWKLVIIKTKRNKKLFEKFHIPEIRMAVCTVDTLRLLIVLFWQSAFQVAYQKTFLMNLIRIYLIALSTWPTSHRPKPENILLDNYIFRRILYEHLALHVRHSRCGGLWIFSIYNLPIDRLKYSHATTV